MGFIGSVGTRLGKRDKRGGRRGREGGEKSRYRLCKGKKRGKGPGKTRYHKNIDCDRVDQVSERGSREKKRVTEHEAFK